MFSATSHPKYHAAEQLLHPYLQHIYSWTTNNDLPLNPSKSTATLLNSDTHEYNITLKLFISNITVPATKTLILGFTMDMALKL
jgi:hypothetical protein